MSEYAVVLHYMLKKSCTPAHATPEEEGQTTALELVILTYFRRPRLLMFLGS